MTRLLVISAFLLILAGCGGGNTASSVAPVAASGIGTASFTVNWPPQQRLIPNASQSIVITINHGSTQLQQQTLKRPSGSGPTTANFTLLPVESLTVTATAYPNTNGTGIAQATATVPLTIVANKTVPISITMNSTIVRLALTPNPALVTVGSTQQMSVVAYDADGAVVLLSLGKLQWKSSNTSYATVDGNGIVTGVKLGSCTISVTDTESGKSVSIALASVQQSVAYQVTVAHTGSADFGVPLNFPSAPTWSVDLGAGALSYALIANGRVYVMGTSGNLYCLNEATGKLLWSTTGSGFRAQAYDNDQVFMLSLGGGLRALNAATGAINWSEQLPGQYSFDATPTAVNGTVYAGGSGGGGTIYSVDEATGAINWTQSVENGSQSAPAIDSGGLFVSYPCQDYDLSLTTGSAIWHYSNGCDGGGGKTESVANGRVYDRENGGIVFDETSGAQVGKFMSDRIPALNSTIGCFLSSGTLTVKSIASNTVLWTFTGDGSLNSAPLIIDQTVIIGSGSGNVYALNAKNGQQIWSGNAGAQLPAPDEQNVSQPLTGFAAGEGYLIVTAGSRLTAWHIIGE